MSTKNKLEKIDEQINELEIHRRALLANIKWKCPECNKSTAIKNVDFYNVLAYYPWGDPFDYGYPYYGSNEVYLDCPKCKQRIRIMYPKRNKIDFKTMKYYFKSNRYLYVGGNMDGEISE